MKLTDSAQDAIKYNLHHDVYQLSQFFLSTYWKSIHLSSVIKLALQTILTPNQCLTVFTVSIKFFT